MNAWVNFWFLVSMLIGSVSMGYYGTSSVIAVSFGIRLGFFVLMAIFTRFRMTKIPSVWQFLFLMLYVPVVGTYIWIRPIVAVADLVAAAVCLVCITGSSDSTRSQLTPMPPSSR